MRDGERCVHCRMTRAEHFEKYGRDITVDHIDKMGSKVSKDLKNNSMENLQTLCLSCHSSKDNIQNKITNVQAINIRHMKHEITTVKIAELYGITQGYVSQILSNAWRKSPEDQR